MVHAKTVDDRRHLVDGRHRQRRPAQPAGQLRDQRRGDRRRPSRRTMEEIYATDESNCLELTAERVGGARPAPQVHRDDPGAAAPAALSRSPGGPSTWRSPGPRGSRPAAAPASASRPASRTAGAARPRTGRWRTRGPGPRRRRPPRRPPSVRSPTAGPRRARRRWRADLPGHGAAPVDRALAGRTSRAPCLVGSSNRTRRGSAPTVRSSAITVPSAATTCPSVARIEPAARPASEP